MFVYSSAIVADTSFTKERLTLDQAIVYVLEHNPMLKAADYDSRAAAARIRTARITPGLLSSIELDNFGGGGSHSGSDKLETTLRLSKVLELGDKAALRGEFSHDEAMLLRDEQDSERLDLLAETTKRFTHVITDQQRIAIAFDSLTLAKNTLAIVQQRVAAGKSPNTELRRSKITLARKKLELDHAEHELETSRVKLATLWGDTRASFSRADAELFVTEQPDVFTVSVGNLPARSEVLIKILYVTELAVEAVAAGDGRLRAPPSKALAPTGPGDGCRSHPLRGSGHPLRRHRSRQQCAQCDRAPLPPARWGGG